MKERKNIFIVTGEVHEGKSTFVRQFSDFLLKEGKNACGFITRGTFKDGIREDFALFDIKAQKEYPFISSEEVESWVKFKRFYFNPDVFIRGMKIMETCVDDKCDLVILDEIGPMEAEKGGWHEVMNYLVENPDMKQIWVCRDNLAKDFANEMNIPEDNIFSVAKTNLSDLHKKIFK
jgi:nucleoside-triphosphatase THEP1